MSTNLPQSMGFGAQNAPIGFDNNLMNVNSGNFDNKWANNENNQSKMKQDWSAFESLLPNQSKGNENSNNNVKKLSDNEMMDLLS